jgi:hypothetical protein
LLGSWNCEDGDAGVDGPPNSLENPLHFIFVDLVDAVRFVFPKSPSQHQHGIIVVPED